ncbi:MAG: hypothetical protein GF309_12555, partial [Candidatus Lokiarchaeota archaeon]|nr:hypothetical protein [Candidatus Lokiarchaeota archaeon]
MDEYQNVDISWNEINFNTIETLALLDFVACNIDSELGLVNSFRMELGDNVMGLAEVMTFIYRKVFVNYKKQNPDSDKWDKISDENVAQMFHFVLVQASNFDIEDLLTDDGAGQYYLTLSAFESKKAPEGEEGQVKPYVYLSDGKSDSSDRIIGRDTKSIQTIVLGNEFQCLNPLTLKLDIDTNGRVSLLDVFATDETVASGIGVYSGLDEAYTAFDKDETGLLVKPKRKKIGDRYVWVVHVDRKKYHKRVSEGGDGIRRFSSIVKEFNGPEMKMDKEILEDTSAFERVLGGALRDYQIELDILNINTQSNKEWRWGSLEGSLYQSFINSIKKRLDFLPKNEPEWTINPDGGDKNWKAWTDAQKDDHDYYSGRHKRTNPFHRKCTRDWRFSPTFSEFIEGLIPEIMDAYSLKTKEEGDVVTVGVRDIPARHIVGHPHGKKFAKGTRLGEAEVDSSRITSREYELALRTMNAKLIIRKTEDATLNRFQYDDGRELTQIDTKYEIYLLITENGIDDESKNIVTFGRLQDVLRGHTPIFGTEMEALIRINSYKRLLYDTLDLPGVSNKVKRACHNALAKNVEPLLAYFENQLAFGQRVNSILENNYDNLDTLLNTGDNEIYSMLLGKPEFNDEGGLKEQYYREVEVAYLENARIPQVVEGTAAELKAQLELVLSNIYGGRAKFPMFKESAVGGKSFNSAKNGLIGDIGRISHGLTSVLGRRMILYIANMPTHVREIPVQSGGTESTIKRATNYKGTLSALLSSRRVLFQTLKAKGIVDKKARYNDRWVDKDGNLLTALFLQGPEGKSIQDPIRASDADIIVLVKDSDDKYVKGLYDVAILNKHRSDLANIYTKRDRLTTTSIPKQILNQRRKLQFLIMSMTTNTKDGIGIYQSSYGSIRRVDIIEGLIHYTIELHKNPMLWRAYGASEGNRRNAEKVTKSALKRRMDILTSLFSEETLDALISYFHRIGETAQKVNAIRRTEGMLTIEEKVWRLSLHILAIARDIRNLLELDPGPLLSDIDFSSITTWLQAYRSLYAVDPGLLTDLNPLEAAWDTDIDLDITETVSPGWLNDFLHNSTLDQSIKDLSLQSVAWELARTGRLADDWAYPPYEVAEWRYFTPAQTAWTETGALDAMATSLQVGTAQITQQLPLQDTKLDRIQLYLTDVEAGDKFRIEVEAGDQFATGTTTLSTDGTVDITLSKQLTVTDEPAELIIPVQDAEPRLWLTISDDASLTVDKHRIENRDLWIRSHDAEKGALTGWQKVGVSFETGTDVSVETLTANRMNYLDSYFHNNPKDQLPCTWIAAVAFNTTDNSTHIEYTQYERRETQIYSDIPDRTYDTTPVYIYGDELPLDYVVNGLRLSDQNDITVVSANDLIDLVYTRKPGVLVMLEETVPIQILQPDDTGVPAIQNWLKDGNQIVSAGVLPFEKVWLGGQEVYTDDYLYSAEISAPGTQRMSEAYVSDWSNDVGTQPLVTYQASPGFEAGQTNETYQLSLNGDDDWVELEGFKETSDGSHTFVFAFAIDNVDGTSLQYQTMDISMDGEPLFERVAVDQFRNGFTGLGRSKALYHGNNRLYVHHLGDINDPTLGTEQANYLCYMTVRDELLRGNHKIRISDNALNKANQKLYIMDLDNIFDWENRHRPDNFRRIQAQYGGLPTYGAGVYAVTGKDVVVSAWDVHRNSFTLNSFTGVEPGTTYFATDLSKVYPYRTYSKDATGQYGEYTFRVGAGLFTMLDMVTPDSYRNTLAELNYVLTGVVANWRDLMMTTTADDSGAQIGGSDFEGLLVELTTPSETERTHRALNQEQDFKHDGRY